MSTSQSGAAGRRWADIPTAERRRRTGPAVAAASARRSLGAKVLNALAAAGIRVELDDRDGEGES